MLTEPLLRWRALLRVVPARTRALHDGPRRRAGAQKKGRDLGAVENGTHQHEQGGDESVSDTSGKSLFEQLFPEQEARRKEQTSTPHVPDRRAIPLGPSDSFRKVVEPLPTDDPVWVDSQGVLDDNLTQQRMRKQGNVPTLLVLRHASKNLTEDDFRRLVPHGAHLDGWVWDQSNFTKVITGRELHDLAFAGFYYLLFSTPLAAYFYQRYVSQIHEYAMEYTPRSLSSHIAMLPAATIEGVDMQSALRSYSLLPPSQQMELRQLKPPLAPMLDFIAREGGYPGVVNRKGRMPFEARLTMEGDPLSVASIRHAIFVDGYRRGLPWSDREDGWPPVTLWDYKAAIEFTREVGHPVVPRTTSSDVADWSVIEDWTRGREEDGAREYRDTREERGGGKPGWDRKPSVYIIGFETEATRQRFVQHWHRRTIAEVMNTRRRDSYDDPEEIINVEAL